MKDCISFFKRDINMTNDSLMRKVLRRYGGLAVAVYEEVLAMVYETGGYFLPWTDDYALDIADRLYEPDQEKIRQIIEMLIEVGLFSKEHFDENGVITSFGIQKRYAERSGKSHRGREIQQYAIPDNSTARDCAKMRAVAQDCAPLRGNARDCAPLRENARDCAPLRENARDCAKMRSRERERARDRALDPPPYVPPLTENGEEESASEGKTTENLDATSSPSPIIPHNPSNSASNALPAQNNPNTPPLATGDSTGNYEDSMGCPENDPVSQVISLWNEVFKGTGSEYVHLYPTAMIANGIQKRLKLTPELETFRKVFIYARKESEGTGLDNRPFVWTLGSLFHREESFDLLLAKATVPPSGTQKTSSPRGAPVLTTSDYDRDPW